MIAFLRAMVRGADDPPRSRTAHYLDEASADLLAALARELDGVTMARARRRGATRRGPIGDSPSVIRIEPGPLEAADTLALAEAATDAAPLNPHLLTLAAERSGGNPQFLRDLLRAAAQGAG